jgi:serine/threonine protein phosphatase PrpC
VEPYYKTISFTHQGLVRKNNEDNFLELPEDGCFAVMDGMGGGSAGEIASRIAVDCVRMAVEGTWEDSPGERRYAIYQALHRANAQIVDITRRNNYQSMGCTVSILILDPWNPQRAFTCQIGDSRIYCYRHGELFQLTTDHTIGNDMIRQGRDIAKVPERMLHVLTRVVGTNQVIFPTWQEVGVCENDIFLICSDGITTMLSNEKIAQIFADSHQAPEIIVDELKDAVLEAGAHDNFTMICVKFNDTLPDPYVPGPIEIEESDRMMTLAEQRIDYGIK